MNEKSLKEKTVSALFWNFMDKGGQQIFQFVFLLFLAGLLSAPQFGMIAILGIFTAVANILQESGFSSALIRKKDVTEVDYATTFYFNISISIFIYTVFFFLAPSIARFYNEPVLTNLSRFLFFAFVFNSFAVVQNVHLVRTMNFRMSSQISLFSSLAAGVVAVVLAYKGFGVWSLAFQQVVQSFLRSLLLAFSVKWTPKASFSFERLKLMSAYSSKLLLKDLLNQIILNIYANVIAKKFTSTDAGYYSQADRFGRLPQSIVASSLQGVAFPLLNNIHGDGERKKKTFRKIIRVVSFLCFPIAMLTIVVAEPILYVLWQDKWLPIVPILRVLAIAWSVVPLFYLLASLLQSLGRSGLLLKIETSRNLLSLLTIIFSVRFGVEGVVWGISGVYIISFVWGYYVAGKTINYSLKEVFKDVFPYILISGVSFLLFLLLYGMILNKWVFLFIAVGGGSITYLSILKVLGSKVLDDFIRIVQRKKLD